MSSAAREPQLCMATLEMRALSAKEDVHGFFTRSEHVGKTMFVGCKTRRVNTQLEVHAPSSGPSMMMVLDT